MSLGVFRKQVMDNFIRPDQTPAAGWTTHEAAGLRIVSNELWGGIGGGGGYWAANPLLTNFELYFVVGTQGIGADDYLEWRSGGVGAYGMFLANGDVNRYDPGPGTVTLDTIPGWSLAVGDELAVQHIGSALAVFKNGVEVAGATDGTYTTGRVQTALYGAGSWSEFSLGIDTSIELAQARLGTGGRVFR